MNRRNRHTPEERHEALTVYASCEGRRDLYEKTKADLGLQVSLSAVRSIAYEHRELYEQIKAEVEQSNRLRMQDRYGAFSDAAMDAAEEGARQTMEALQAGSLRPKELPRATREMVEAARIATEEKETLAGRRQPASPVSFTILLKELAELPGVTVRGVEDSERPQLVAEA